MAYVPVMSVSTDPVLVTGATGFIASEIVRQLLERGYRVRGTTRDPQAAAASGELTSLPGAADRLDLVAADLNDAGSYADAVTGCEYVIHVASPYTLNVSDPQRDLVDPAVNGTVAVLDAAARVATVSRVVLTSSFVAIGSRARPQPYTEADWNDGASIDHSPYAYSKTMAERAAWEYVGREQPGFDLVSINPTVVIGPTLVRRVNESYGFFIGMTDGSQPAIVAIDHPAVDVRDVALAHILSMENPAASGRYLLSAGNFTLRHIADSAIALGLDEKYRFPRMRLDTGIGVALSRVAIPFQRKGTRAFLRDTLGKQWLVDASKSERELGLVYRDMDETIADTWRDLDRWGLLGKR